MVDLAGDEGRFWVLRSPRATLATHLGDEFHLQRLERVALNDVNVLGQMNGPPG